MHNESKLRTLTDEELDFVAAGSLVNVVLVDNLNRNQTHIQVGVASDQNQNQFRIV
jgi:hypothetical protein